MRERAGVPLWLAITLLMLHGGDYVGRVIGSHLLRTSHPWPDLLAPVVALGLAFAGGAAAALLPLLPAYLTVKTAWGIARTLHPMRAGWRWTNPLPSSPS